MNKRSDSPLPARSGQGPPPSLTDRWLRAIVARLAQADPFGRAAPAPLGEQPADFVDTQPSWHGR